jgi:hypothetical protein
MGIKHGVLLGVFLAGVLPATAAIEVKDPSQFVLEVKGVVCSFCFYGARQQLSKVNFVDRQKLDKGLAADTKNGTITAAILAGKEIDFVKTLQTLRKGGYDVSAIHLRLVGKVDEGGVLTHAYNGQKFKLVDPENNPWKNPSGPADSVSVQALISEDLLAKVSSKGPVKVTVP